MPELPEVETVRAQLHNRLAGAKIVDVHVWRLGRLQPEAEAIVRLLVGRRIVGIQRRAKLLIWLLDGGDALTAHLKMTGRFTFVDQDYQRQKHDRVHFILEDAHASRVCLVWSDVRQFGFLKYVSMQELQEISDTYGPEPLEVSAAALGERLHLRSTRTIKAVLLDQTVIAGIGNIYADESCHQAGIRPTRRVQSLTQAERMKLATAIQLILNASVKQRGTSAQDYLDTEGKKGGFLELLHVYGREGEVCKACNTRIKKIVLGQRGTRYCPTCQK